MSAKSCPVAVVVRGVSSSLAIFLALVPAFAFALTRAEVHSAVAKGCPGHWTKADHEALVQIAWRESSFWHTLKNKRSTAHGLFQFLKATRKKYGTTTASSPDEQAKAAWRYCRDRYGSPVNALAWHEDHGWY